MHPGGDGKIITSMSRSWVRDCLEALDKGPCVLVTLRQHKGSSPRESGARMVVREEEFQGSIGGGNLEHLAITTAREILFETDPDKGLPPRMEPYGLGPHLNQCCGGAVELLFEVITARPEWLTRLAGALDSGDHAVLVTAANGENPVHHIALPVGRESELPPELRESVRVMLDGESDSTFSVVEAAGTDWWLQRISRQRRALWLFGAGHVGKAVVKVLADLPFEIRWIDERGDQFPEEIPANVTVDRASSLPGTVSDAPSNAVFIVMTHSHELDEELCHAILTRADFDFLGLIGSKSKASRFKHRLGKRGIADSLLERLVCPIGLPNIAGKEPATIALSLAAQLMSDEED